MQVRDEEPEEAATPEREAEESFGPLLIEAAKALDPSASDPSPGARDHATLTSQSVDVRLAAGTLVAGRYRLDRPIGEGGMGEVWAATHAITRRRVAMKFLKGSAAKRPEMQQRFLREARAVSLVRHPSVVEVLDVFEVAGGLPVMVMELLVGETLRAKLARAGPLAVGNVATLLLPAIRAVAAAHARGIVHRDLKPDNVFLQAGEGGRVIVKVLDFGIAKLTASEGEDAATGPLTGTGSVLGTPWYMAPEQLSGEKDIDPRADVWALGVILYESLSGRRPVDGSNVAQIVSRLLRDGIVPIEDRVPGLAPEIARLVSRMLARDRNDRPRDLAEVHEALARHAECEGLEALESKVILDRSPLRHAEKKGLAVAPSETRKPHIGWDSGVPHAVPAQVRDSRSFRVSRIRGAWAALAVVGILAWGVAHSPSPRTRPSAQEASAILTTSLATISAPDRAAIVPAPPGDAGGVGPGAEIAASPVPEASSIESARRPEYGPRPATFSPSNALAPSRLARGIVDAATTAPRYPSPIASADAHSASSTQPKTGPGGLFEAVPF